VHERVHPVVALVDPGERLSYLAVVGQLNPNAGVGLPCRVRDPVERDDPVTVLVQFAHDVRAQLPAAARDRDGHHRAPPLRPAYDQTYFETGRLVCYSSRVTANETSRSPG